MKRDEILANPKLTPRHNARAILCKMKISDFTSSVKNMKYHNLCTHQVPPPGIRNILGLSLPFCLQSHRPNQDISKTMSRLRHSVRLKDYFHDKEDNPNFNPILHIPLA